MVGDNVQIEYQHRLVAPLGVRIAAAGGGCQRLDIAPVAELSPAGGGDRERLPQVDDVAYDRLTRGAACLLGRGAGNRGGDDVPDCDLTAEDLHVLEIGRGQTGSRAARGGRAGAGRRRVDAHDRTVVRIAEGGSRKRCVRRRSRLGRTEYALTGDRDLDRNRARRGARIGCLGHSARRSGDDQDSKWQEPDETSSKHLTHYWRNPRPPARRGAVEGEARALRREETLRPERHFLQSEQRPVSSTVCASARKSCFANTRSSQSDRPCSSISMTRWQLEQTR